MHICWYSQVHETKDEIPDNTARVVQSAIVQKQYTRTAFS